LRFKRARAQELRTEVTDPRPLLDRFEYYLRGGINTARKNTDRVIIVCQPCFDKDHTPEELAQE
jgi:hypothetical protein